MKLTQGPGATDPNQPTQPRFGLRTIWSLAIGRKILVGFLIMAGLAMMGGGFFYFQLRSVANVVSQQILEKSKTRSEARLLLDKCDSLTSLVGQLNAASPPATRQTLGPMITEQGRSLEGLLRQLASRTLNDREQALLMDVERISRQFVQRAQEIVDNSRQENDSGALPESLNSEFRDLHYHLASLLLQFDGLESGLMHDSWALVQERIDTTTILLVILVSVSLLFGAVMGLKSARSITRPISQLIQFMDRFGTGDFDVRVEVLRDDELGYLAGKFNAMLDIFNFYTTELTRTNVSLASTVEELRTAEEKYRIIFEHAPVGIYQSTPEGRYIHVNSRFAKILGYDSPQDVLETIKDTASQVWVDPEQRLVMYQRLEERGEVRNFEAENKRKDGHVIWVSRNLRAVHDKDGRLIFYEGFIADISARVRAQQALRRSHHTLEMKVKERTLELSQANADLAKAKLKAEEATQAKSEFLANMSHEVRTPLNGVIAAADLALAEPLPPKVERYLHIVTTSARSLLAIVNDILDFSKIEAGHVELEYRPFDPIHLFEELAESLALKATEKGIEFLLDLPPKPPWLLIGDAMRLKQILMNLAGNAVKFTGQGFVVVGMSYTEQTQDRVELSAFVKDSGLGIPADQQYRLFQPFCQADASTTRKFGGTGLGLYIAKQLTEAMGGTIGLESTPGQGSVFTIRIPFSTTPALKNEDMTLPEDIGTRRILIVDDCSMSRKVLNGLLKHNQFILAEADSGFAALDCVRESQQDGKPFDLIILDWSMPDLDGVETATRMRSELGFNGPMIMLTAFGRESQYRVANEAGINAFLFKPVSKAELFKGILNLLGRSKIEPEVQEQPLVTYTTLHRETFEGARVLVVEDNPVNQEIALALLETVGIFADVAENGHKAVEAVGQIHYDAVLMDIQMPEMDGYEATRRIRQDKRFSALPIIAMTAHAMKGDEETCLKAGMDGYVSKPINQKRLFEVLSRFVHLNKPAHIPSPPFSLPPKLPGLDILEAMGALGCDDITYLKIVAIYFRENQEIVTVLKAAKNQQDWLTLERLAHSLKSASAAIGARQLQKLFLALEQASKNPGPDAPGTELIDDIESSLSQVIASLALLIQFDGQEKTRTPVEPLAPEALAEVLRHFAGAIATADVDSIQAMLEHLKMHCSDESLAKLERQLDDYDYDDALATLSVIARRVGASE